MVSLAFLPSEDVGRAAARRKVVVHHPKRTTDKHKKNLGEKKKWKKNPVDAITTLPSIFIGAARELRAKALDAADQGSSHVPLAGSMRRTETQRSNRMNRDSGIHACFQFSFFVSNW